jgi:hypothetical protein
MLAKSLAMPAALAALLLAGAGQTAALAQTPASAGHRPGRHYVRIVRRGRPRIVVTPGRLLYRRCVERLELQHRPSGTVLFPLTYCWWVRE